MQVANGKIPTEDMARARDALGRVQGIFSATVVGQRDLYQALIVSLMARGHVLLESVPGLAKTTAAVTLSEAISGSFSRIQCTPDLMPNDIVGTQIYTYETGKFSTQLGPVHANMVLLDEINRSSAKTQSAMLEAMQERQTSIGGTIYKLPDPFMVLATQNPVDEEGTYVLPEAQMDRFLLKEILTYPTPGEEIEILTKTAERAFGNQRPSRSPPRMCSSFRRLPDGSTLTSQSRPTSLLYQHDPRRWPPPHPRPATQGPGWRLAPWLPGTHACRSGTRVAQRPELRCSRRHQVPPARSPPPPDYPNLRCARGRYPARNDY